MIKKLKEKIEDVAGDIILGKDFADKLGDSIDREIKMSIGIGIATLGVVVCSVVLIKKLDNKKAL